MSLLWRASSPALGQESASAPRPDETKASDASCVHERYISVTASPDFDPTLAVEVRKDLAAELAPRGFGVCASKAEQGELVAEVLLVQRESALVAIQIDDYTTGKRLARDVRLARIPSGGVALAIAIATDELLRASWAELMLRREASEPSESEPEPERAEPAAGERRYTVTHVKRPLSVPAALAFAFDYTFTRRDWHGLALDARVQLRPFKVGFFELGGGGGLAVPVKGEYGTARAAGALGLVTIGGCAEPSERFVLCAGARGLFQWTRFRGVHARDAKARRADLTSFVLSAVGQLQAHLSERAFLFGELSLGGALLSAQATDQMRTVLGIEGVVLGLSAGVGFSP